MKDSRLSAKSIVLAASTLVAIALHEYYSEGAIIPVPGDVPTYGFGTTRKPDGSPVNMSDKTTPTRALVDLLRDVTKFEQAVKRCAPVPMYSYEFAAFVSLTYNIGETAFCKSTLARNLNAGDYEGACREILRWDKFQGKPLRGLTLRRQSEFKQCVGESS